MAKKFYQLEAKMLPAARERSDQKFHAMIREIPLRKLRYAHCQSYKTLSEALHLEQAAIKALEQDTDSYLSSLRAHRSNGR